MDLAQQAWLADESGASDLGGAPPEKPLVLDLDGTLLCGDMLFEAVLLFVRRNPVNLLLLFGWLLGGIANLKDRLAMRICPAVDHMPVNEALVAYARAAHAMGRPVVLATASNEIWARAAAARFSFIDDVIASCAKRNLKGRRKADALVERFPLGYTYVGDATSDLRLWRGCGSAIFAGREGPIRRRLVASKGVTLEADFTRPRAGLRVWGKALRVHQWAKNMLVFAPMLLAGRTVDVQLWSHAIVGFLALCLTASATYLFNDMLDIPDDRRHWQKKFRPIAAGSIDLPQAAFVGVAMVAVGFLAVWLATGLTSTAMLGCYCAATISYSFGLKRIPILDAVLLAGLFTLRLAFGSELAQVVLSNWLAVFSMILFASLALAKRAAELARHTGQTPAGGNPGGRGYVVADLPIVVGMGTALAVAAPVIMVLYLIDEAFPAGLYRHPQILWLVPTVIGLWLARIWLLCGRGILAEDPVSFATRDRSSLAMGGVVISAFVAAMLA